MLKPHEQEAHARVFLPKVLRLARREARASQGDPESAALAGLAMALQTWDGRTSALSTWIYRKVNHALQHDRRDNSGVPRPIWEGCNGSLDELPEQYRTPLSFHAVLGKSGDPLEATLADPQADVGADLEFRAWVEDLLSHLTSRQRSIITECVLAGRSQDAVAAEIGLSQMHVSREKRTALAVLRLASRPMTTGGQEGV